MGRFPVAACLSALGEQIEWVDQVHLTATRAETEPKVFTHIHLHFKVSGNGLDHTRVARAVAVSADKYCSASIMLARGGVEITHDFQIVETEANA